MKKIKTIKTICVKKYTYSDGKFILATETDVKNWNYTTCRATKKCLINNFSEILTNDNCSPKEAKETLQKLTRDEILEKIESYQPIVYFD